MAVNTDRPDECPCLDGWFVWDPGGHGLGAAFIRPLPSGWTVRADRAVCRDPAGDTVLGWEVEVAAPDGAILPFTREPLQFLDHLAAIGVGNQVAEALEQLLQEARRHRRHLELVKSDKRRIVP
jgi:hypothetical protein